MLRAKRKPAEVKNIQHSSHLLRDLRAISPCVRSMSSTLRDQHPRTREFQSDSLELLGVAAQLSPPPVSATSGDRRSTSTASVLPLRPHLVPSTSCWYTFERHRCYTHNTFNGCAQKPKTKMYKRHNDGARFATQGSHKTLKLHRLTAATTCSNRPYPWSLSGQFALLCTSWVGPFLFFSCLSEHWTAPSTQTAAPEPPPSAVTSFTCDFHLSFSPVHFASIPGSGLTTMGLRNVSNTARGATPLTFPRPSFSQSCLVLAIIARATISPFIRPFASTIVIPANQ